MIQYLLNASKLVTVPIPLDLTVSISDIIAIVALFMSLLSTFVVFYRERFSVSIECTKILINFDKQFSPPTFELMILNRSTLPISIKKIEFNTGKYNFMFEATPSIIYNNQQSVTKESILVPKKTAGFPIVIDGLSALSAFFRSQKSFNLSTKELEELSGKFYIYTSRKKKYKTASVKLKDIQIIICDLEKMCVKYDSHSE